MAGFLDGFENGALSMVRPPYSSFWKLNPSLKSVLQYFQTFGNVQPFLGKLAKSLGCFENGAMNSDNNDHLNDLSDPHNGHNELIIYRMIEFPF